MTNLAKKKFSKSRKKKSENKNNGIYANYRYLKKKNLGNGSNDFDETLCVCCLKENA